MDAVQVVVLALIQGVTEFLPISSSGHLILPSLLTDWPDQGLAFDVAVHVGSIAAVVAYFRRDLFNLASGSFLAIGQRSYNEHLDMVLKVGVATLPAAVCGFLLKDWVEQELRTVVVIATATIGFGVVLGLADRRAGIDEGAQSGWGTISWLQAVIIGLAQALAIVPGTSRSGITITAALFLGLSRSTSARFSLLLSLPTIGGAALLLGLDLVAVGVDTRWTPLIAGAVISGMSAYACIHYFLQLIERTGMTPYVIYRLLLGSVLLGLWYF